MRWHTPRFENNMCVIEGISCEECGAEINILLNGSIELYEISYGGIPKFDSYHTDISVAIKTAEGWT